MDCQETRLPEIDQVIYDTAREEVLAEILRLAEVRHQALLTIASSGDARAAQVFSACATMSAGCFAVAAALIAAKESPEFVWIAFIAGALFTLAAICAIWAASPEGSYQPPGMEPKQLWHNSVLSRNRLYLLGIAIRFADESIAAASSGTVLRGRFLRLALWIATATPAVALIGWIALRHLYRVSA